MTSTMRAGDLDEFVQQSDLLGGPGAPACQAYWAGRTYEVTVAVDETLDPFSEDYVSQQLAVYHEISGREFDQFANEFSTPDVETHAAAVNPYDHPSPGELALHMLRLNRALHFASPPRGGKLLDMGCGWGLSSEVAAYCGLNVTAVDINPEFVRLVQKRAERLNLTITAQQGAFDTFVTDDRFDAILFYECFHHALRPWELLRRMAGLLTFDGKIAMAGEPINEIWWNHWGLRLDPLSIYCIRKFGWFESGWSATFLQSAFEHVGLNCSLRDNPHGETGYTVIGDFSGQRVLSPGELHQDCPNSGWSLGGGFLTSLGDSLLSVAVPAPASSLRLDLVNFRSSALRVQIIANDDVVFEGDMPSGGNVVRLQAASAESMTIRIKSELWCPDDEIGNGDSRRIGILLRAIGVV